MVVGAVVSVVVGTGVPEVVGVGLGLVTRVRAFCRPLLFGFSCTRAPRTPAAPPPLLAIAEMVCPGGVVGFLPLPPALPLPLPPGAAPASGADAIAAAANVAVAIFQFTVLCSSNAVRATDDPAARPGRYQTGAVGSKHFQKG